MVKPKKLISKSEKQTLEFGKKIAKECEGGEVFFLKGELGAGKTVFVKGVARGFGIKTVIQSPTFVLRREYMIPRHKNIKQLLHIDLYRLPEGKAEGLEFLEDAGERNVVTFIEWPERIKKGKVGGQKRFISFHIRGEKIRVIEIKKNQLMMLVLK